MMIETHQLRSFPPGLRYRPKRSNKGGTILSVVEGSLNSDLIGGKGFFNG